jgi:hypothetical protein
MHLTAADNAVHRKVIIKTTFVPRKRIRGLIKLRDIMYGAVPPSPPSTWRLNSE